MTKEAIVKEPSGRVRRTPIGTRNILTVNGKDPNYVYRIVNDDGDRIQRFKDAGYEVVQGSDVQVGDKRVNSASASGSGAEISVGGGQKAFVMRIPKEWYEQDQTAKQRDINELEASMKQKALSGNYGTLDITRDK